MTDKMGLRDIFDSINEITIPDEINDLFNKLSPQEQLIFVFKFSHASLNGVTKMITEVDTIKKQQLQIKAGLEKIVMTLSNDRSTN